MAKRNRTHGEVYFIRKQNLDFTKGIGEICRQLESLPKRMKRKEALEYYGKKLKLYFLESEQVEPSDFIHKEHIHDYYYAKKLYMEAS